MKRTPIHSSNLRAIGYNAETLTMEVEFKSDVVYEYTDVPQDVYDSLMAAQSAGRYFHDHIVRVYASSKVGKLTPEQRTVVAEVSK